MTVDAVYLLQLTLNGITLGLIYALIAVGLSLIFGVMEIINFAHGELLMLGAFAMTFALPVMGLLYWPSLAVAILAIMLFGLAMYEVLLARLRPDEFERAILITLGLSIIVIHVMQYLFTATPRGRAAGGHPRPSGRPGKAPPAGPTPFRHNCRRGAPWSSGALP